MLSVWIIDLYGNGIKFNFNQGTIIVSWDFFFLFLGQLLDYLIKFAQWLHWEDFWKLIALPGSPGG